ncbi:hypothetical protein EV401DRAFT_1994455 [Pisolithus croceorrhizus]|nr:hypothetical protein EV401DRAFT_1994455 [Pisolithus croceorrhizus]
MVDKRQRPEFRVCLRFIDFLSRVGSNRAYNEGEDHSLYILESSQVVHHCLVDSLAGLCFAEDLLAKTVFSFPLSSYLRVFSYTHSFFPDTPTTSSLHFSFKSTNTAGPTVIITTTIVTTVSSIPTQSSSLSSTPIAAIVGGIVGGIVVLLIVLLIYFIRSRSYKIVFGGDSEPDRVINRSGRDDTFPQLDLSDEADNITPFDAYATDGDEGMRQYDQSSFASRPSLMGVAGAQAQHQIPNLSVPPSSASYDSDGQFYLQGAGGSTSGNSPRQSLFARPPQGAALPAGQYAQPKQPFIYDTAPADWHAPRPGLSLQPSTVPSASAISGSAKEREVAGERGPYGLGLVQCKPLECSEAPLGPTGGWVVVHQDAGRAPEEVDMPQGIPPAYDSIQH